MKVVIRADASLQMGSGHIMRCLTLAHELKIQGADVRFICRKHEGNLIKYIEAKEYSVYPLDVISYSLNNIYETPLVHAHWLGATQKKDAEDCASILENVKPDWLIVDHYALDSYWQNQLINFYRKLMVVDDLADRSHKCDLLLDQTFGREKNEYTNLVPQYCKLLLGAQFSLLRSEFSKWREYSLKRRSNPRLKKILITMGGIDINNVTGQILEELKKCALPDDVTITVILGMSTPNVELVNKTAQSMPYITEVKVGVNNMAELMANADLAIGAAGATTWERCCMGLPSLQIVVADNQMLIAHNLKKANVIKYIENVSDLPLKLKEIMPKIRKKSLLSSAITDGCGSRIVCSNLLLNKFIDKGITLKPIQSDDCEYVYSLQTAAARKYSRNPTKPTWNEHIKWFTETMNSDTSVLFVVTLDSQFTGILRLDNIDKDDSEISIIISPEYSGRGIAKKSLKQVFKLIPKGCFKAVIHKDNIPSQHVFEKVGFKRVRENGVFLQYATPKF